MPNKQFKSLGASGEEKEGEEKEEEEDPLQTTILCLVSALLFCKRRFDSLDVFGFILIDHFRGKQTCSYLLYPIHAGSEVVGKLLGVCCCFDQSRELSS